MEQDTKTQPKKPEILWKQVRVAVTRHRGDKLIEDLKRLEKKTKRYGVVLQSLLYNEIPPEANPQVVEVKLVRSRFGKFMLQVGFLYKPRDVVLKKHELCGAEIWADIDEGPDYCPEWWGGCGKRWKPRPQKVKK